MTVKTGAKIGVQSLFFLLAISLDISEYRRTLNLKKKLKAISVV